MSAEQPSLSFFKRAMNRASITSERLASISGVLISEIYELELGLKNLNWEEIKFWSEQLDSTSFREFIKQNNLFFDLKNNKWNTFTIWLGDSQKSEPALYLDGLAMNQDSPFFRKIENCDLTIHYMQKTIQDINRYKEISTQEANTIWLAMERFKEFYEAIERGETPPDYETLTQADVDKADAVNALWLR